MNLHSALAGQGFEELLETQKCFMNMLIARQSIPTYPFDIRNLDKQQQGFIRTLGNFLKDEVSEVFIPWYDADYMVINNLLDKRVFRLLLESINIELADCVHFQMELMIFCGIDDFDLDNYYQDLAEKNELESLRIENDILQTSFAFANYHSCKEGFKYAQHQHFKVTSALVSGNTEWAAGNTFGPSYLAGLEKLAWQYTYSISQATNMLKLTPWPWRTEADGKLDYATFKLQILETWFKFIQLCDYLGWDKMALCRNYKVKNDINIKRLNN